MARNTAPWRIVFSLSAYRQLARLPRQAQRRITAKLEFYIADADALEYAQPMVSSSLGQYRFRIGEWRVLFDVRGRTILVRAVGNRKDIYR